MKTAWCAFSGSVLLTVVGGAVVLGGVFFGVAAVGSLYESSQADGMGALTGGFIGFIVFGFIAPPTIGMGLAMILWGRAIVRRLDARQHA